VAAAGRGDCDSLDRPRLREGLRQRVHEGRRGRRIGKWRRAGVRADEGRHPPESGVVPGGVSSPGRATVFLQQVLEEWCEREVRPRLQGHAFLLRLAADVCIGGERAADARQIMAGLPKRCARSGFTIPLEKTAWSAFGQPEARQASAQGHGTCAFLGLTHYWAQSRRGVLGEKPPDSEQAPTPHHEGVVAVVSPPSSRAPPIPVSEARSEVVWALPLRGYPGERPPAGSGATLCGESVAVRAESPQ
jgi:hypothetical protein